MHRRLFDGYIDGKRGRGRPRLSWYDNIKEWIGMRYEHATRMAMRKIRTMKRKKERLREKFKGQV